MPRIRSLKPELPQDAVLASRSRGARYTFVLLLTQCDDAGFFRANLRILLGQLYPHDLEMSETQLAAELDELTPFIDIRDGADGPIGHVRNWKKHQRIDRPTKSFLEPLFAKATQRPRATIASESRAAREPDAKVQRTGVLSPESLSPESRVTDLKSLVPSAKQSGVKRDQQAALAAGFDEFWNRYPKRSGGNPRKRAMHAWSARRGEGVEPQTMLDGLERYRAYLEHEGKIGTPYVLQASTFLGPDARFTEAWDIGESIDPLEQRAAALIAEQEQRELDDAKWLASRMNGTHSTAGVP